MIIRSASCHGEGVGWVVVHACGGSSLFVILLTWPVLSLYNGEMENVPAMASAW